MRQDNKSRFCSILKRLSGRYAADETDKFLSGIAELQIPNNRQMEIDKGHPAPGSGIIRLRPESRLNQRWGVPRASKRRLRYNDRYSLVAGRNYLSYHKFANR